MHFDCLFGNCQCFSCSYLLRCFVPYFCCIYGEAFLCSCWPSNFCQISSGTTPCFHAFHVGVPRFHFNVTSQPVHNFKINVSLSLIQLFLISWRNFVSLFYRCTPSCSLLRCQGGRGNQRPRRQTRDGSLLRSRAQQDHLGVGSTASWGRKSKISINYEIFHQII